METKTISVCLNTIDFGIVENLILISLEYLEDIHNRLLECGEIGYMEVRVSLLKVLKHINYIIGNFSSYQDNECLYNEYVELRKLIVEWVIEYNTEAGDDKKKTYNSTFTEMLLFSIMNGSKNIENVFILYS